MICYGTGQEVSGWPRAVPAGLWGLAATAAAQAGDGWRRVGLDALDAVLGMGTGMEAG